MQDGKADLSFSALSAKNWTTSALAGCAMKQQCTNYAQIHTESVCYSTNKYYFQIENLQQVEPYFNPTSTLLQPYFNPTSTLLQPYVNPTSTSTHLKI